MSDKEEKVENGQEWTTEAWKVNKVQSGGSIYIHSEGAVLYLVS